jgi:prepilin-type N-terminal cleavage/methylation domain-containing protein
LEFLTVLRRVGPDTPNPGMGRCARHPAPPGFTLLEIIVVLLVIGVAFALAAPAFPNRSPETDPLQRVLDLTRRTAVHHAEALALSVTADGQWRIDSRTSTDVTPIGSGTLSSYHGGAVTVKASALGACTVETVTSRIQLDPVRCRLLQSDER